jgi:hypothetical protein
MPMLKTSGNKKCNRHRRFPACDAQDHSKGQYRQIQGTAEGIWLLAHSGTWTAAGAGPALENVPYAIRAGRLHKLIAALFRPPFGDRYIRLSF